MALYCGIDLHSNNCVAVVIDEAAPRVYEKRLSNDLELTLNAVAPYWDKLARVAVESTFNWYWLANGLQAAWYPMRVVNTAAVSRLAKHVRIAIPCRARQEPLHVLVDSTGLKVYGEGEWKVRQRRRQRKLHLAVDGNAEDAAAREARLVVPPREKAAPWEECHPRNAAPEQIAAQGLAAWKQVSGNVEGEQICVRCN